MPRRRLILFDIDGTLISSGPVPRQCMAAAVGEHLMQKVELSFHDVAGSTDPIIFRQALLKYHWPGNVRELKNAVERALLLSPPGELDPEELLRSSATTTAKEAVIPFPAELDRINVAAVKATVALCAGNRSEAARRLAISRRRLRRLLDEGAVTSTGGG